MDSSLDSGGYNFSRFRSASSSSLVVYTFGEPREVSRGYENNPWTAVHNIRKVFVCQCTNLFFVTDTTSSFFLIVPIHL
jgi:hypothetical protein